MCGRFALGIPKKRLEEVLDASLPDSYRPCWNIGPGRDILCVDSRGVRLARWGMVPLWNRDGQSARPLINARGETVFGKKSFSGAVRNGRCVVPAGAFYEWRKQGRDKVPFAFAVPGSEVMFLAGLIQVSEEDGATECVVITSAANAEMAPVHDRMPVILGRDGMAAWLSRDADPDSLAPLLRPLPDGVLRAWPVGSAVNRKGTDGPELLREARPVPVQGSLL